MDLWYGGKDISNVENQFKYYQTVNYSLGFVHSENGVHIPIRQREIGKIKETILKWYRTEAKIRGYLVKYMIKHNE